MFCTMCGAVVSDDAEKCPNCGKVFVKKNAVDEAEVTEVANEEAEASVEVIEEEAAISIKPQPEATKALSEEFTNILKTGKQYMGYAFAAFIVGTFCTNKFLKLYEVAILVEVAVWTVVTIFTLISVSNLKKVFLEIDNSYFYKVCCRVKFIVLLSLALYVIFIFSFWVLLEMNSKIDYIALGIVGLLYILLIIVMYSYRAYLVVSYVNVNKAIGSLLKGNAIEQPKRVILWTIILSVVFIIANLSMFLVGLNSK